MHVNLVPWKLYFDGSNISKGASAGILITSPEGIPTKCAFTLERSYMNNHAEYEALLLGLELLMEMGARVIEIMGDSQLIINQVGGLYRCADPITARLRQKALRLVSHFDDIIIRHIPREENGLANDLAQMALRYRIPTDIFRDNVRIGTKVLNPFHERVNLITVCHIKVTTQQADWREEVKQILQDPSNRNWSGNQRLIAMNYVIWGNDLYKRDPPGRLLKCLDLDYALIVMAETREGVGGC